MRTPPFSGPGRTVRPLHSISQVVIIVGVVVGIAVFMAYSFAPMLSDIEPTKKTETVIIDFSSNGVCKAESIDQPSPKLISNCNYQKGDKVIITFKEGLTYASIVP